MSGIVIGEGATFTGTVVRDVCDLRFDSATDMWMVTTPDGRTLTARTVVDTRASDNKTVAVHGRPNHFRTAGPDAGRRTRFVARCLELMERSGSTRMEARSRITLRPWRPQPLAASFYLSGAAPADEDVYDGPVVVGLPDGEVITQGRLTGHLGATDGRYHWRGTLRGDLPADLLKGSRTVTLAIGARCTPARVVERTPWGSYTVAGDGEPPYPLDRTPDSLVPSVTN